MTRAGIIVDQSTEAAEQNADTAVRPDPAVSLLALGLLRLLARLHGVNESLLTGERRFDVAIPDQSSLSPETPRVGGVTENHDGS